MGGFSIWHWLIVAIVVMLLFGKGRISDMMGDLGKGIKSFKKGITEDDAPPAPPVITPVPPQVTHAPAEQPAQTVDSSKQS